MKNVVIKFPALSQLAAFLKMVHLKSYTINTIQLTLKSRLTDFELAISIEEYGSLEVQDQPTA